MIKKIAWDAFKNTGDINTFLEFKQIENIEEQIGITAENINKEIMNKPEENFGVIKN